MKLRDTPLSIPAEGVWLQGRLRHAPDVRALTLVLHAGEDGGARQAAESARAMTQDRCAFATLVVSLVTAHESEKIPDASFNIPQLANRCIAVTEWISHQPPLADLPICVLSAGNASAATLRAAWKAPNRFAAIVARGGRPDLAGGTPLKSQTTPIRVIVAASDPDLPIVQRAYALLGAVRDLVLLPATPSADTVHALAAEWFVTHLDALERTDKGVEAPGVTPNA